MKDTAETTICDSPVCGDSFFAPKNLSEYESYRRGPAQTNLRGKTRDQLEVALRQKPRSELIDLIYSLVTIEQLFKPSEIAARCGLNKRAVLRDLRAGKFGDYFVRAENSICVPASGVVQWLNRFRVRPNRDQEVGK